MPQFTLTDDDRLFPVFCIRCRKQIPKDESNYYRGLCEPCSIVDQEEKKAQAADALEKKRLNELNLRDKSLKAQGYWRTQAPCRFCKEGGVFVREPVDSYGGLRAAGCLGALCFPPLLLLCFAKDKKGAKEAWCPHCGQQYTV